MGGSEGLELFHEVAQPASARVRRYVTDHGLLPKLRFRNIVYAEVKADFDARGGTELPALWDGRELVQGAEAVLARLQSLSG